jgi:hypothetical protein
MTKPDLQREAIRLRVKERKSLGEIQSLLSVAKSTLSLWLRPYPLSHDEMKRRLVANAKSRKGTRTSRTLMLQPKVYSDLYQVVKEYRLKRYQIAQVAETAIMLRLLARGYSVYGSVFDGDRADWLVEVGNNLWKIQVKSTVQGHTGLPIVTLRRANSSKTGPKRYVKGEFDFIVGYDLRTDTAYVWSWKEAENHRVSIAIHPDAKEAWHKLKNG